MVPSSPRDSAHKVYPFISYADPTQNRSRMLQSRKNEVQSVRASTIRKLSAKETASRCCNSSGITSIALAPPPPIVTSRRCLSPSSNGKPSPEKRSSSAERKRPMTPSSPWRLSPRSCTPVDEGMKDFRLADRRLCNARKPDGPWPAMRNLSDSFRFECYSEAKKSVHDFRLAVKITENGPENFKPVENSHHRTKKKKEFNSFAKQGREITATQRPSSAHSRLAHRPASPRNAPVSVSTNVRPSSARPAKNNYAMATISSSAMSRNLDVSKRRKDTTHMVTDFKLRMLHNRFLQWLFLNSRANAAMVIQMNKSARILYSVWAAIWKTRESIVLKRIRIQCLKLEIKLISILKNQVKHLEEWESMEREHCCSLSDATDVLNVITLPLPVMSGTKADINALKAAISSAVDVLKSMGSPLRHLLSRLEGVNSAMSELTQLATEETTMLDECRILLSSTAALQVQVCSLRAHILQLKQHQ